MRLRILIVGLVAAGLSPAAQAAPPSGPIRIGLIGLDSSHAVAFTKMLNDPSQPDHVPGARVIAAWKGGSPDVEASSTRIEKFTAELQGTWKVQLTASIAQLVKKVDAVIITSVDGRRHLEQLRPVLQAKKRVFVDKPLTAGHKEAKELVRLARASGTPFFSSSSMRFVPEFQGARNDARLDGVTGAISWGPAPIEPHHPDLFWYGIHAVEMLYTVMGPGCVSVSRVHTEGGDSVVGRWRDGRIGIVRGIRTGAKPYGMVVFGQKAAITVEPKKTGYHGLVLEIVKFFQTGQPPVSPEETLEMMAFMQAADLSKARHGAEVTLAELDRS